MQAEGLTTQPWAVLGALPPAVSMTTGGRPMGLVQAPPKIRACCSPILLDLSVNDVTQALHDPLEVLQNLERVTVCGGPTPSSPKCCAGGSTGRWAVKPGRVKRGPVEGVRYTGRVATHGLPQGNHASPLTTRERPADAPLSAGRRGQHHPFRQEPGKS